MPSSPTKTLETFENPKPETPYLVEHECPEFTCVCPKTGQPDFATLQFRYFPDKLNVELKSLKLYLWSFREEGAFHEKVTNQICDDFFTACTPRALEVRGIFGVRGGIYTTVVVRRGNQELFQQIKN